MIRNNLTNVMESTTAKSEALSTLTAAEITYQATSKRRRRYIIREDRNWMSKWLMMRISWLWKTTTTQRRLSGGAGKL
jgi:hypothetical protein